MSKTMTTQEIINHFEDIRKNNPRLYYGGLGAGADSFVMNPFVSGSFELGLVIGAKYALEHFAKAADDREVTAENNALKWL